MRRRNDAVLVAVRVVDRNLGLGTRGIDHQLSRAHQQFGIGLSSTGTTKYSGRILIGLWSFGFDCRARLLLAEGRLGHSQAVRTEGRVGPCR